MDDLQPHSFTVLSATQATDLSTTETEDLVDYFDPDTLVLVPADASRPTVEQARWALDQALPETVTLHTLASHEQPTSVGTDAGTLLFAPSAPSHDAIADALPADQHTFVLTDSVTVEMDMLTLSATIDGIAPFRGHDAPLTVFSGGLDADYWVDHDGLTVRGLAPVNSSNVKIPHFTLGADGLVTMQTLAEGKLGLRALSGMGATYATRFRQAGYETVADIHDASRTELLDIKGVGDQRAEQFEKQAQALVDGEIVRFDDEATLPTDVVHIDIETDGLNPTIIWQIGLYDPRADECQTFLQKDPTDKAAILREFGEWLRQHLDGRAVVAYNGWTFDFPQLDEFFVQHCPEYESTWRRAHKVDPYDWAVRDGNAAFPSRGNGLDEVAAALGYDREATGLDGATTGRAYRRWMENPCEATELDWERHTTYCREDVLALHHIYECLLDSGRIVSDQNTDHPTEDNTTQETLFDYS